MKKLDLGRAKEFILGKPLPYIKVAAVVLYFIFVCKWALGAGVSFMWYPQIGKAFMLDGILVNIIFLYTLTWLYRFTVNDDWRGLNKASAWFTVSLLGINILLYLAYALIFKGMPEAYMEWMLYMKYVALIYIILINLALFFVFGRRKFSVNKKTGFKVASILLLIFFVVCTVIVLVGVQELQGFNFSIEINNTEDVAHLVENLSDMGALADVFNKIAALVGLSLYLLLWINTKPRETANAVYKNSTIVRL